MNALTPQWVLSFLVVLADPLKAPFHELGEYGSWEAQEAENLLRSKGAPPSGY
jgi:hypothetical protein